MTHSFSIREAIRFGWHTVKNHSAIVFQVVLTLLAVQIVTAIVQKTLYDTTLGTIVYIVLVLAQAYLGAGAMLISLKLARGEHAHYAHLSPGWRLAVRYVLSGLLAGLAACVPLAIGAVLAIFTGLATLGSLVNFSEGATMPYVTATSAVGIVALVVIIALTVIATFYISLRYCMSRLEVLDGARIVESLRKSAIITRGVKWKLFGFIMVIVLMNIIGAILLLLPLLVTIPISMIAMAHVYTKIRAHHHA